MYQTYGIALVCALLFCIVAFIGAQVLLGMAVYNDALAKGNDSPMMWALLVGFLGLIPGIIYLCIRSSTSTKVVMCPNCGWGNYAAVPRCARCGAPNPYAQNFNRPDAAARRQSAKTQLIWGVALYVVAVIIYIVGIMGFVMTFLFRNGLYY